MQWRTQKLLTRRKTQNNIFDLINIYMIDDTQNYDFVNLVLFYYIIIYNKTMSWMKWKIQNLHCYQK